MRCDAGLKLGSEGFLSGFKRTDGLRIFSFCFKKGRCGRPVKQTWVTNVFFARHAAPEAHRKTENVDVFLCWRELTPVLSYGRKIRCIQTILFTLEWTPKVKPFCLCNGVLCRWKTDKWSNKFEWREPRKGKKAHARLHTSQIIKAFKVKVSTLLTRILGALENPCQREWRKNYTNKLTIKTNHSSVDSAVKT